MLNTKQALRNLLHLRYLLPKPWQKLVTKIRDQLLEQSNNSVFLPNLQRKAANANLHCNHETQADMAFSIREFFSVNLCSHLAPKFKYF